MKKARYGDAQIMGILKQADSGVPVSELCREHGMSNASFYKWRAKFGGMDASMWTCRGFVPLLYLGLRVVMIEQPNIFSADQLVAAALALKERWQHCPDGRNGWSTFDSVEGDMVEVEKRGLLKSNELADFRTFFDKRHDSVESGKFG